MGNVERVDKTLAINDMVYYVRKDPVLQERWVNDLEALTKEFGCTPSKSMKRLKASLIQNVLWIWVYINILYHTSCASLTAQIT